MGNLSPYLSIAGLAHRQACQLKRAIAKDHHNFPKGDLPSPASQLACCEAIVALVQSVFAWELRQLEFSPEGKAIARVPPDAPMLLDLLEDEAMEVFES